MKKTPYSLRKADLTRAELMLLLSNSREVVLSNQRDANEIGAIHLSREHTPHVSSQSFALDGAILSAIDPRSSYGGRFFRREGRMTQMQAAFCLRGVRYLASINPEWDVRLKLRILNEDLIEALRELGAHRFSAAPSILRLALCDYAKNACVTLLNAYLQREKIAYPSGPDRYVTLRAELSSMTSAACRMFYAAFVGAHDDFVASHSEAQRLQHTAAEAASYIEGDYSRGRFSSRYLVRPEASHPLTIAASSALAATKASSLPDTIIGLPSGGTELAFAYAYAFGKLRGVHPKVLLIPLSSHSSKSQFDNENANPSHHVDFLEQHRYWLAGRNVYVVDDNSSTGRTLHSITSMLDSKAVRPRHLTASVAEADLVRSELDIDSEHRQMISSAACYGGAVAVLPVSRRIKPKVYLVELKEKRRLRNYFTSGMISSLRDRLKYQALLGSIDQPIEEQLPKLNNDNAITTFRHTFLSNFYAVDVTLGGRTYPSVEHGYQRAKFDRSTLLRVNADDVFAIGHILRTRGRRPPTADLDAFFEDPSVSAGHVKVVADYLRRRGYSREDWDDSKLDVMIDLLLQKFAHREMRELLWGTADKELVEVNSWEDTYWGVFNGRGKNLLGRLIMAIRGTPLDVVSDGLPQEGPG